jgi:cardiolipin synthase A/B
MYRVEGPVVAQMQSAFMDNWLKVKSSVLQGDAYFPELTTAGVSICQAFKSSYEEGGESARLMYLFSISCARKVLRIENSYFVPDKLLVDTMIAAKRRGVRVQIIAPGPVVDAKMTRFAARSRYGDLLKGGVEVYEYQPTLLHAKLMIVDEVWAAVGSTNFDNRSFRLNDEINVNILDPEFAKRQSQIFDKDLAKSKPVTLDEWQHRPMMEKAVELAVGVFRSQM